MLLYLQVNDYIKCIFAIYITATNGKIFGHNNKKAINNCAQCASRNSHLEAILNLISMGTDIHCEDN